jgi:metal-responsive CopG/Arc/MetJ family transcriptional regulator
MIAHTSDVIQRMEACISIRMPAELVAQLDAEARKSGCSTSDIVRQLLKWALDVRHRGKLPVDPYV